MTIRKPTKRPRPSQWLGLTILVLGFLFYLTLCHGGPLARAVQEQYLPPPSYDHAFDGDILLMRIPMDQIGFICKGALLPGQTTALGCSQLIGKNCRVMIAKDEDLKQHGFDYDIVFRHEQGHCNGWLHERK